MNKLISILILILCAGMSVAQPRIEKSGTCAHIVSNGKPMLMIGGEMGNSSASTIEDVRRHFRHLSNLRLNTVLVPVSWELIEPEEGKFDMTTLDNLLTEARDYDLKLVLLWFGAWKNSMSCYTPEWFKRDTKRFPRAHLPNGMPVEEASSLSKNVLEADKKAFCKVMQYLRDNDKKQTVIMVQVENEIGMINVPRDYSDDATKLYKSPVPKSLTDYLDKNIKALHPYISERYRTGAQNKSWSDMFGDDIYTEEIFQTWTYATYVQQIAEAGRKIYDIPMYVNVALNSRGRKPGEYPSGGPLAHLIDIWHAAAPAIDVLGVDIYDKGIKDWLSKYHLSNNPLFIPEIRLEDKDAMYALYAFGHHGAMGFCPFSIEDYPLSAKSKSVDMSGIDLTQDDQLQAFSMKQNSQPLSPLAACYRLLRLVEPLILERQGTEDMEGVLLTDENRQQDIVTPDGIRLSVKHSYSLGWEPGAKDTVWPEAACIILRLAPEDYMVIGSGVVITYSDANAGEQWKAGDSRIGLAKCELLGPQLLSDQKLTKLGKPDELKVLRHLSGDQTHQGRHVRIPVGQFEIQHFRLYRY